MNWGTAEFQSLFLEPSRNGVYKPKEFHGSGAKIINMGELFAYDRVGGQPMARLNMTDHELLKSGVQSGDLLFGRRSLVEEGAGRCAIAHGIAEPTTFESSIIRVRLNPELADPSFYFYYFRSPLGRALVRSIVSGATVKGIRGSDLQRLQVAQPPLETQQEIATALAKFDDLIENNQRRIALLEESARLLYREWFVNLRDPGGQQNFGTLPAGWDVKPMTEMAVVNRASLSSKDKPETIQYIDIASVETGVITSTTKMQYAEAPGRARRLVQHGDVIWSCVRPNRRSYAMIWNPDDDVVVSTGFAVLTAKTVPFTYLYLACTSDEFVAYLTNRATGAAYPAVSGKDFEEAQLLCPDQDVLRDFHERCLPLFELRNELIRENGLLGEARNALLPKLMSGEIQV